MRKKIKCAFLHVSKPIQANWGLRGGGGGAASRGLSLNLTIEIYFRLAEVPGVARDQM
jgi:hypothetical protein